MVNYAGEESLVGYLDEQVRVVWNTRFLIAGCAIAAALAGYFAALWFPIYQATVVIRPQSSAQFVGLGSILTGSAGDWHRPENIATAGYELFLRNVRNKFSREAALSLHRSMFGNLDLDDRQTVLRLADQVSILATDKTALDRSATITFRYRTGSSGASFLNTYIDEINSGTAVEMISDATATLEALQADRERELERLRRVRDVALKQSIAKYNDAIATATAAGIEGPVVANLGTTAVVVGGNTQLPLYYYGITILRSELKNLESHLGDDLAIAEFAGIQAALKDVEARLAAISRIKLKPVVVSEDAFQSARSMLPSPAIFAAGSLLGGAILGYLWALLRARRRIARR